jgi:hypothetical protein
MPLPFTCSRPQLFCLRNKHTALLRSGKPRYGPMTLSTKKHRANMRQHNAYSIESRFGVNYTCILDVQFRCAFPGRMRLRCNFQCSKLKNDSENAFDSETHIQTAHLKRKCLVSHLVLFIPLTLQSSSATTLSWWSSVSSWKRREEQTELIRAARESEREKILNSKTWAKNIFAAAGRQKQEEKNSVSTVRAAYRVSQAKWSLWFADNEAKFVCVSFQTW